MCDIKDLMWFRLDSNRGVNGIYRHQNEYGSSVKAGSGKKFNPSLDLPVSGTYIQDYSILEGCEL